MRLFLCCGSLSLFASRAFSSAAALPPPLPTSSASSLRLFLGQSCLISSFNFLFFVSWEDLALQTAIASQRDQIPLALSRIVGTHTLFPPWIRPLGPSSIRLHPTVQARGGSQLSDSDTARRHPNLAMRAVAIRSALRIAAPGPVRLLILARERDANLSFTTNHEMMMSRQSPNDDGIA